MLPGLSVTPPSMRKMLKLIGWASRTGKALLRHACLVQNHLASPTGGVDFDEEFIQHAIIHIWGQVPHKEGVLRAERREQDSETRTNTFVLTNSILVRPFLGCLRERHIDRSLRGSSSASFGSPGRRGTAAVFLPHPSPSATAQSLSGFKYHMSTDRGQGQRCSKYKSRHSVFTAYFWRKDRERMRIGLYLLKT